MQTGRGLLDFTIPGMIYNSAKDWGKTKSYKGESNVPQITFDAKRLLEIKNPLQIQKSVHSGPGTSFQRQVDFNNAVKKLQQSGQQINLQNLKKQGAVVSQQDLQASLHDAMYYKAKNKNDVYAADTRMIESLKSKSSLAHPIEAVNNLIGVAGIQFKRDVLDPLNVGVTTTGEYYKMDKGSQKIVDENIQTLQSIGYGKKKKRQKKR